MRFVALSGSLAADPAGRAPGRGAYTCLRAACFERAVERRAFARALRQRVEIPSGLAPEG